MNIPFTSSKLTLPVRKFRPPYDWSRNNEDFLNPPLNTFDVFTRTKNEVAPALKLADVPPVLTQGLVPLVSDRLGFWMQYLLFYPLVDPKKMLANVLVGTTTKCFLSRIRRLTNPALYGLRVGPCQDLAKLLLKDFGSRMEACYDASSHGISTDGEPLFILSSGNVLVANQNIDTELMPTLVDSALSTRRRTRPSKQAITAGETPRNSLIKTISPYQESSWI